MEQQGIRDRAYKFGYEFVTFIAVDEKPTVPDWFPKQRLYASHARFGTDQAVAVIDSRAKEALIESRKLTVVEQALILEKRREFERQRHSYLNSHQGGVDIRAFVDLLSGVLRERFKALADALPTMGIEEKPANGYFIICGEVPVLVVQYRQRFINTIDDSELSAALYRGFPRIPGYMTFEDAVRLDDQLED